MDSRSTSLLPPASVDATSDIPEGKCALSYTPINVEEVINSVRDDGAGATAVFIGEFQFREASSSIRYLTYGNSGTTRNSFKGISSLKTQQKMSLLAYFGSYCDTRKNRDPLGISSVLQACIENHWWHRPRSSCIGLSV
jgi:hypothetical protein